MKRKLFLGLALWGTLIGASLPLQSAHRALSPPRPALRWEDVLLDLLGEGRTVLARLLYFKMDAVHEQLDENGVSTFKQSQLFPLLRMVTYLDPSIVDAYDILAYDLFKGHKMLDEAIQITEEGLLYNPSSYVLNWRRAFFALRQKDWQTLLQRANLAYVNAGQDPYRRTAALRLIFRVAVVRDDWQLGLAALRGISAWLPGLRDPEYDAKFKRWTQMKAEAGDSSP